MNFKNLSLLILVALTFAACGDDDSPATQQDQLVAKNWVYGDIYVANSPIGFTSCLGDDFLSFTQAGAVTFDVGMESDTCALTAIAYSGTYELRNDSLFIDAIDTDGEAAGGAFEITLINETELRLQGEDPFFGTSEARYTAQ